MNSLYGYQIYLYNLQYISNWLWRATINAYDHKILVGHNWVGKHIKILTTTAILPVIRIRIRCMEEGKDWIQEEESIHLQHPFHFNISNAAIYFRTVEHTQREKIPPLWISISFMSKSSPLSVRIQPCACLSHLLCM